MTASPPDPVPATPAGPVAPAGPAAVIERWRAEVAADGAPDTLLWRAAAAALDLTHAHPAGIAKLLSGRDTRLTELFREPASRARALRSARAVRAKELELDRQHGLPGCYLLAGAASWTPLGTPEPAAPVFLRRCRVRPLDPGGSDYVVEVVGEMAFSPVLRDHLASAFGIFLDAAELTRISLLGNGFDPTGAFAALEDAARGLPGWALHRTLRITTAHAARAAAVVDFERSAPRLAAHPVVARLLAGVTDSSGEVAGSPDNPDELFVLDADPSQVAVLERVRDGVSLVVDAGPGTGKSQTIINLAADLARVGARTLILVPSRVGRASVAGRLDHLGLAHLLHEPRVDQAPWLSVRSHLTPADPQVGGVGDDSAEGVSGEDAWPAWSSAREALHAHVVRMHGLRRPWGVSLDEIQSRLIDLTRAKHPPRSKVRISGAALAAIDPAGRERWRAELTRIAELSAWSAGVDDPWWGADIVGGPAQAEVRAALDATSPAAIARLDATFEQVFVGVAVPALPTLGHYRDFVAEMTGIAEVLSVFRLGVFDAPLEQLLAAQGGTRERWRLHRALKGLLRPGATPEQGQALLRRALELRPLWERVRASDVLPSRIAGLDRAERAYAAVAAPLAVLQSRLTRAADAPALLDLPLPELAALIARLDATRDRLDVVPRTRPAILAARAAGLGDLVDDLARRAVPADRVGAEVDLVWWSSVLQTVTAADPGYAAARGEELRAQAGAFRDADVALQRRLAVDLAQQPTPAGPPIVLASPRAAALLLAQDATFDVIVVDEAHAVTPAIAAAALARAPQAVIFGDSRMPGPAGFTACAGARVVEDEEPDSLLDLASRVLPVHRLRWHYRSHDHRLVAALQRSYAGSLATVPAPRGVSGLTLKQVVADDEGCGEQDEQGSVDQVGRVEQGDVDQVERVEQGDVDQVERGSQEQAEEQPPDPSLLRRALAATAVRQALTWSRQRPLESVAIIASSGPLARIATAALRGRAAGEPGLRLADDGPEPMLVLDPATGSAEVRDAVVLVLDADAGAVDPRLLTAAVSRARARMVVVHPFTEGESTGSPLLDNLLAAAAGVEEAGGPPGSVLIDDLARRLSARGLTVVPAYGAQSGAGEPRSAGKPPAAGESAKAGPDRAKPAADRAEEPWPDGSVDLAVRDPFAKSGPMVAVELDGLRYARAGGIRIRERLRVDQLHRLGWRVIHVASVDLFRDPAREVARIAGAIEGLRADPPGDLDGASHPRRHAHDPRGRGQEPRRATSGPVTIGANGPVPSQAPETGADQPRHGGRSAAGADQTRDDTPAGWGEDPAEHANDRRLREDRPPHWGD